MAKITSKPWTVAGEQRPLHIYYSSTNGFYVKSGMPVDIEKYVAWANHRLSGAKTEDELNRAIRAVIQEYELAIKSNRLVIVINVVIHHATLDMMGWTHQQCMESILSGSYHRSGIGYGFGFEFCLAREIASGKEKEYREPNGDDNGGQTIRQQYSGKNFFKPDKDSIVIEYTEERAAFLLQLAKATANIGNQLADFFTDDEAKMIERLEGIALNGNAGQLLLN